MKTITINTYSLKELCAKLWNRFFWPRRKQCAKRLEDGLSNIMLVMTDDAFYITSDIKYVMIIDAFYNTQEQRNINRQSSQGLQKHLINHNKP